MVRDITFKTKKTLQKLGYAFKTTSDTEVVCAAYLDYGQDCVSHFNDMFAFVVYDEKKKLFFGANYRLGQKPFKSFYEDAKQELNEILKDAVSTLLFADVPVDVFLSTGVDSSLFVAIATQSSTTKINTLGLWI